MTDDAALEEVLGKWRARWPEWPVAEVFIPTPQRERALAWLALLGELADAAWAGSDATPGAAKLGWWAEEFAGWTRGARRHPLGRLLQSLPAPWTALAAGLPALAASRVQVGDVASAVQGLQPFSAAFSECSAVLFEVAATDVGAESAGEASAASSASAIALLAERALRQPPSGTPGALNARGLLTQPRMAFSSRPQRIHAALLRLRLQRLEAGRDAVATPWRALLAAWRAARD